MFKMYSLVNSDTCIQLGVALSSGCLMYTGKRAGCGGVGVAHACFETAVSNSWASVKAPSLPVIRSDTL